MRIARIKDRFAMDFPDVDKLHPLVLALAPGFLIMFVRQNFMGGKRPSFQDRAATYIAISAIYFALSIPLFGFARSQLRLLPEASDALEYLVVPLLVGIALAWFGTKRILDPVWQKIGLQPRHHDPTAWDHLFGRLSDGVCIVVTRTNGSQIAGKYEGMSFASTEDGERDLLIDEVYEICPETGVWSLPQARKSILLCGRDIQCVEVFKPTGVAI